MRDAGTVATWGVIRWRAASRPGEVEVVTRSGNTATPDETWSAWSKAYTAADGETHHQPQRALPAVARALKSSPVSPKPADSASSGAADPTSVTTAYLAAGISGRK